MENTKSLILCLLDGADEVIHYNSFCKEVEITTNNLQKQK